MHPGPGLPSGVLDWRRGDPHGPQCPSAPVLLKNVLYLDLERQVNLATSDSRTWLEAAMSSALSGFQITSNRGLFLGKFLFARWDPTMG